MKEIYAWVPWFQALTKKIADEGEEYLVERAKQVGWGDNPALLNYGDENIDPFSFMYFLASKNTARQFVPVYQSVGDAFDIGSGEIFSQKSKNHGFIFPTPPPHGMHLFHDGENGNPSLLWKLFRQAANGNEAVDADVFRNALEINQVGVAKLTQALFLINPTEFMPVDEGIFEFHSAFDLPKWRNAQKEIEQQNGWENYLDMLGKFTSTFRECDFYEINTAIYLMGKWRRKDSSIGKQFFQVSTNVYNDNGDHWEEFCTEYHVRTGGPGGERKYPLAEPSKGDIVLVRRAGQGKGISVVYKNDYAENGGWTKDGRIHVLWLNKHSTQFGKNLRLLGLSRAGRNGETYKIFENTAEYAQTFNFLCHFGGESIPDGETSMILKETSAPLNQIFYGPPGTGKTYHTVNVALEILDNNFYQANRGNRDELKTRFDQLKKEDRIGVVTFHQSFGYEEFVEGICPTMDNDANDEGEVSYEIKNGIFKRMCAHAISTRSSSNFESAMEALQEECTEKPVEILTVAWKRVIFLQYMPEREMFELRSKAGSPDSPPGTVSVNRLRRLHQGHAKHRTTRIKAIFNHLKTKHGLIEGHADENPESHVLIIDEINRGNISRIFGELITLIEESKRLGNAEATSVELPYSGETFGVPKNLYIIGTMNTADRSIALLDTALRRRFRFVEMMPDVTVLNKVPDIDGVDIKKLLAAINARIEAVYDRDHQIGHSFFMRLEKSPTMDTLADIFQHEILPLLQEYFYDDWEKIDLVLNKNGFLIPKKPPKMPGDAVVEDRKIWTIDTDALRNPANYQKMYADAADADDS